MLPMTHAEKLAHLASLAEDNLRATVLMPLLVKLGFHDPVLHHHSGEKGKDIICKDSDEKLGKVRYLALVVKAGDLTGAASGTNSYFTLLNQIKQALNEPCRDIYEIREISIDQVMVVISGRILPTALDSVFGTLRAERLDRLIRDTIDGEKLVKLLDEKLPAYWTDLENPKEALLRQRNLLLNNLGKLIAVLVPDATQRERALSQLGTQEFEVALFPFQDMARYMVDFGYGRISIDKLDEAFDQPFLNTDYEDIRQQILEFRKRVQRILYDISDGVDPLVEMMETTDPQRLTKLCKDADAHTGSYSRMTFDVSGLSLADDLIQALAQYRERGAKLRAANCSDLYQNLMRDLQSKVAPALIDFYQTWGKEGRDRWVGFKVSYRVPETLGDSSAYHFQAEPKLLRDDIFKDYETSRVYSLPPGTLHIEFAPQWFGFREESKMSIEEKARDFLKHYERALAESFFEGPGMVSTDEAPTRNS